MNYFDQDGREPITLTAIAAAIAINAAKGAVWDIAEQMIIDQRSFSCIDWGQVAESAITDGLTGGLGKLRQAGKIAKVVDKGIKNVELPTQRQIEKFRELFQKDGVKAIEKSQKSIQNQLEIHLKKLAEYEANGGYTSSVKREIRNFERELEAIKAVLGEKL